MRRAHKGLEGMTHWERSKGSGEARSLQNRAGELRREMQQGVCPKALPSRGGCSTKHEVPSSHGGLVQQQRKELPVSAYAEQPRKCNDSRTTDAAGGARYLCTQLHKGVTGARPWLHVYAPLLVRGYQRSRHRQILLAPSFLLLLQNLQLHCCPMFPFACFAQVASMQMQTKIHLNQSQNVVRRP